jgi:hypothetical protein
MVEVNLADLIQEIKHFEIHHRYGKENRDNMTDMMCEMADGICAGDYIFYEKLRNKYGLKSRYFEGL